jgi:arsenite methyltransferase
MYAGCVSGALLRDEYLNIIQSAGFRVEVVKEKPIEIPDDVTDVHMDDCVMSITVKGFKI